MTAGILPKLVHRSENQPINQPRPANQFRLGSSWTDVQYLWSNNCFSTVLGVTHSFTMWVLYSNLNALLLNLQQNISLILLLLLLFSN